MRDEVKQLAETVLRLSKADETEVVINGGDEALTRFAEDVIHQNVARTELTVTVRAFVGKRMAEATTNRTDEESLKAMVERAIEAAKQMPEDENILPRLKPQTYQQVQAVDDEIVKITPKERAELIAEVVGRCKAFGTSAAGALSNSFGFYAIANSNGLFAYYERTNFAFSITVSTDEGTGWASASGFRKSEVDVLAVWEKALQKALLNKNPKELPPGSYRVVLEPPAVADLLLFMASGFNALAVDEGRSWLVGKLGQKVVGDNITLVSDVYHPLHQGCPFDAEGHPTQRVVLIENGVAKNLVYDRVTAQRHNVNPTGHSVDPTGAYGAFPRGLVMEGEEKSLQDLIAETDKGLLVSRLWYIRTVDPMKVLLTGMTRDGVFLIENGQIVAAVKNFRFNESVIAMLNKVEAMSKPERAGAPEWEWSEVMPALRVSEFRFTDVTVFAG
ncbi:MAG: TldD/PmbA family protein [Candidatus Fervidibacter sp.]|uniref:TldD/PmbA family protein n=1 Tax=Candidatus Fervidibacter sp. TaxID=3100871 RepID=UPI00404B27E0